MRYPMILPWLARKSGISQTHARQLWADALHHADRRFAGGVRGSAYWGCALAEFRRQLKAAGAAGARPAASAPLPGAGQLALACLQFRVFTQAAAAWTGFLRGASVAWPRLMLAGQRAA